MALGHLKVLLYEKKIRTFIKQTWKQPLCWGFLRAIVVVWWGEM